MIKGAGERERLRGKKRIAEERSRMQRVVGAGGGSIPCHQSKYI